MPGNPASGHPLIQHKLGQLRDQTCEPALFRKLVEDLSLLIGMEACADLQLRSKTIPTPLTDFRGSELEQSVAIVPILRAGLGMESALLRLVPDAQVWHLGIRRDESTLKPVLYYPIPDQRSAEVALILDPMLATAGSAIAAARRLRELGVKQLKFVGILGAPEGIQALRNADPEIQIFLGAVDDCLNERGYILPGLGDAGDRQFATS